MPKLTAATTMALLQALLLSCLSAFPAVVIGQWSPVPLFGFDGCACAQSVEKLPALLAPEAADALLQAYLPGANLSDYGLGCRVHDFPAGCDPPAPLNTTLCGLGISPAPPGCVSSEDWEKPSWCSAKWCYIADPEACTINHWPSEAFANYRHYSYATCGQLDDVTGVATVPKILQGKVVRVGMRHNSGGWTGSFHPLGNTYPTQKDDQWNGPLVDLMQSAAAEGGYIINYTDIPQWVTNQSSSNSDFTNCVYGVSLGYLDMCVGDFTVTQERVAMSKFVTITLSPYYLAAPLAGGDTLMDSVLRVFKPFDWEVWLLVGCVLISVSLMMVLQDSFFLYSKKERTSMWPKRRETGTHLFWGLRSFTDKRGLHSTVSWGSRVSSIGLGMFLMLTISMYSANLVNILVVDSSAASYADINEAIEDKAVICTLQLYAPDLAIKYPGINLMVDDDTGYTGLLYWDKMWDYAQQGRCDAVVVPPSLLATEHAEGLFCDWRTIGFPVLDIFSGFPLGSNPELMGVQHAYQKLLDEGVWSSLLDDYEPESTCAAAPVSQSNSLGFEVTDFLGVLVILMFFIVLGLITSVVDFYTQRKRVNTRALAASERAMAQADSQRPAPQKAPSRGSSSSFISILSE